MRSQLLLLTLIILSGVSTTVCYHILCYHPVPSKSHDILAWSVIKPLWSIGHKITWVTPYPDGKPKNITVVDVSDTIKIAIAMNTTVQKESCLQEVKKFSSKVTKTALNDDLKQALTQTQYDVVISEWFFSDVEAGLAAVQGVPWILLSGLPMHPRMEELVDVVRSIPTIPAFMNDFPIPMNFWQRLFNTLTYLHVSFLNWLDYNEAVAEYEAFFKPIAEARGVILPPYSEAIHNISILLLNSHPSFAPAQSLPPNVINIGGFHIEEETPALPKDLQDIMDSSPQGVVYFSMGSVVKAAAYPEQAKRELIELFGSIPYTVLWKFEERFQNLPKNVHVRSWMPQSSILAHPNIKVFISHCGILSALETVHFGVPMLALPLFGDQPGNADNAVRSGYALQVTFRPDMKEELRKSLMEILNNDRYSKRVKEISRLFRNRTVSYSKLIVNYVELAIESKGAYHLRSKNNLYEWYQNWMLDQIAALLGALFLIYFIIKRLISLLAKSIVKEFLKYKKKNE